MVSRAVDAFLQGLARVLEEDMASILLGRSTSRKLEVERDRCSEMPNDFAMTNIFGLGAGGQEDGNAIDQHGSRQPVNDGVSMALRSVSELSSRPNSTSVRGSRSACDQRPCRPGPESSS